MIDTDRPLDEADVDPDPLLEFQRWYALAEAAGIAQPNGMALATTGADGAPSVRFVLLHGLDERGLTFFTNYASAKGADLERDPRVAVALWWEPLHRQVRLRGPVARVAREESEAYWASRPYGSRISASASPQSRVIVDRGLLEREVTRLERLHPESPPLPAYWGGYRLRPQSFEFWQGRRDRLHDRLRYERRNERDGGGWRVERLAP
ncbi:MAG: pyridoxamine 5'-phosphate oxidase [Candidatus Dormibacteraeota bacterium]|nr:pyridoxamine 5'-phosphate oxidase [Candidatus Dormibacteraeota bacterium]